MAITFKGSVQVPIFLGRDALVQNAFVFENGIGSRVNVNIRRLMVEMDATAVLTTVMPQVKVCRATNVSGGIIVDKSKFDSLESSDQFVRIRTPLAEGSHITATAGDTIYQQYTNRMHTAIEQQQSISQSLLPRLVEDTGKEFKLRPGESLLVYIVGSAVTSNSAISNNWQVNCMWEEDSIATFAISGTVTLSASPVSGAIITVIEADDTSMTNAVLVETIVTGAGGTWASSIKTGKVGAAFVQYENGGTYYTANGSPYLS
jgi:hypothetical protein